MGTKGKGAQGQTDNKSTGTQGDTLLYRCIGVTSMPSVASQPQPLVTDRQPLATDY